MLPSYPTPFPPPPPPPRGTPFLHCLAAAGVWWVAGIVAAGAVMLKTGSQDWRSLLGAAITGAVLCLPTAGLTSLITRTHRFQPWVLILLTLPLLLVVALFLSRFVYWIIALVVLSSM